MSLAKDLKVRVSIDGLCLTSTNRVDNIIIGKRLGDYVVNTPHRIRKDKIKQRDKDILGAEKPQKFERCHHYKWRHIFENKPTKLLKKSAICGFPRNTSSRQFIQFFSSIDSHLIRRDVERVLNDLEKKRSLNFRIAGLHLAIDIIHPTKAGLHKRSIGQLTSKRKEAFSEIGSTTTGGSPKSIKPG